MGQIRNNVAATVLALLALVTQFVVSFGHVHLPGHSHAQSHPTAVTHTHYGVRDYGHADTWDMAPVRLTAAIDCAPIANPPCPQSDHSSDRSSCVICWTVAVAHLLPSVAPHAWPPVRAGPNDLPRAAHGVTRRLLASYQSRAPPLA